MLVGTGFSIVLFVTVGNFGQFMLLSLFYITYYGILCYRSYWGKGNFKFQTGRFATSAITGFVGPLWFGSYIKFGRSDSLMWIFFYIIALAAPHLIHVINALVNNQKITEKERQEEQQRQAQQRRELEQWKQTSTSQINNIFTKEKQYELIYNALIEHGERGEKSSFVKERVLSYFDRIEEWTLDELYARNFSNAVIGLKILYLLKPTYNQYKNAYAIIEDPASVIAAMQNHGLSKTSEYISEFTYKVATDLKSGKIITKPLV